MKPKLAYILGVYPHGQTSIVNELRTLESNNIDVHIIALRKAKTSDVIRVHHKTDYPATYLFSSKSKNGWGRFIKDNTNCMVNHPVNYTLTAVRSLRWGGTNFKLAASFVKTLELIKPTMVYVNWSWATCGSVMYACHILRLPFVFSARGTDITPPARNFPLRVSTAQRILTPSPAYVEILKNEMDVPVDKIRLVPNCLGTKSFERVKSARTKITGPLRLLYVATLRPVKRHEDLIRCCAILRDEDVNLECRIFGDGPDREKLEFLISELNLTENVKLAGHVPQEKLPEQFEWSDIYVHTSKSEGLAHTILEAQASARPLILAEGVGGIRDSVIPGETAIMVPVGQPQEFAIAITELAKNSEARLRMGQAGREFVMHNFSYEHFGPRFLKALFG